MARKQTYSLPVAFPDLADRLKAQDFWRQRNRLDLSTKVDDIADEFRAHHESLDNRFVSWSAAWKTWYVRALRFTPKPKMAPEPRAKGRNAREAFRAPVDEAEYVSHAIVKQLADTLSAKAKRTW
jgi:hypothetical protein